MHDPSPGMDSEHGVYTKGNIGDAYTKHAGGWAGLRWEELRCKVYKC